jgi:plasmid segregation protein ParM
MGGNNMYVAIDPGNCNTKYFDGKDLNIFPSAIGINSLHRNLKKILGRNEFEWEYEGKSGFAGALAVDESEYVESRKDDSKAHFDALMRTLIALHQFGREPIFDIVVGQPISTHNDVEKLAIKAMYEKRHELTVNGKRKIIFIRRCEVSPEGAAAGLLVAPDIGTIRVMDIGSGSVNYATIKDRGFNNRGSWTFNEGMESKDTLDKESFVRQVCTKAINKKWGKNDPLYLCGGGAKLQPLISEYFAKAQLIPDPLFANVKAFYLIAGKLYG